MKRYEPTRRALIFWCLFIGVGAVGGAACMLARPDGSLMGMQGLLPYFQVLPFADALFQNFIFSGLSLLIVNGLTNLVAAWLLIRRREAGIWLGGAFGVTLMLWITIQFVIFPMNFMSTTYFIFGFVQAATGYMCLVFYRQETFRVRAEEYPNVNRNPKRLVVYFSRLGRARKVAYEEANRTGAALFELKTTESTQGTLGFWWCGRFGMHRWSMPLAAMPDLKNISHVTIVTPIWVFRACAPVREFCMRARGRVISADYVLVHFQRVKYARAAEEMDALLNVKNEGARDICAPLGKFKAL